MLYPWLKLKITQSHCLLSGNLPMLKYSYVDRGGHEGGEGGGRPPPSVLGGGRGGKRRRTFLGPKGPKIRKKWISTDIFANFRNSKRFESSF